MRMVEALEIIDQKAREAEWRILQVYENANLTDEHTDKLDVAMLYISQIQQILRGKDD